MARYPGIAPPRVNAGNLGRTYPVKWQLKDANGNYVTDLASFTSLQYSVVSCGAFAGYTTDALAEATAHRRHGPALRYNQQSVHLQWQTPTASNACYVLVLTLKDGTTHLADFQMKK